MIVITGASDGLGLQLAKVFQASGKKVVNISRRESEYSDVNLLTDLLDEKAIAATAQSITEMDDEIEVLINCAGVLSVEKIESLSAAEFDRTFGVNVKAPMLLTSALMPKLKKDHSDIVNVASTLAFRSHLDSTIYGSSKWAMRGFSQNLQVELKNSNRVASFCIGGFKSDIGKKVPGAKLKDLDYQMDPVAIAVFVKQIIDLPKTMEVAEILINKHHQA